MKNALMLAAILFFATLSWAQVTVTVSSPANGATVSSPLTISASAKGSTGITGWYVYVDNSPVWNTPGPAGSIVAQFPIATGYHTVTVRAWQADGAYGNTNVGVNVGAATTASSTGGVYVSLQSPGSGSIVGNTFTVNASASSPNGISGWGIYADNNTVFAGDTYSNSISKSITLSTGAHSIYVRAWDKGGAGYGTSATTSVNVAYSATSTSTSTATSGGALPAVPSTAKVWTKLEDATDSWSSCSNCAGGSSTTTNYWTAPFQTSPSMDGSSRQFYNGGLAWANVLWIKKLGNQDQAKHFLWDFYARFDSTTAANAWTAEYDLWQSVAGQEFMIGSQCNFGSGHWDTWNSATGHWIQTAVPCPRFSADTWHHIQWYVERISWNQYRYDTLVVDGKAYTLNQVFYTTGVNWADSMGIQWQLDLGGNGLPAHEWVDQVKLSAW